MGVAFTVTVVEIALRKRHTHVNVTSRVASLLYRYYASVFRIPAQLTSLIAGQLVLACRLPRTLLGVCSAWYFFFCFPICGGDRA